MIKYKKIFVGSSCNNNCVNCKYLFISREQRPFEEIRKEIENSPGDENIEFFGGEPTIREDFFELISIARMRNFKRIKIVTNGRAFSDWNFACAAIESGNFIFEIKLHGYYNYQHDSITQTLGSFWQTVSGIHNLKSINNLNNQPFSPHITIRIPISKENFENIEEIVKFVIPLKVDKIILSFSDLNLKISEVMPFVKNAIDLSILNRIWILTEKIPLCLMKKYEHHVLELYQPFNWLYKKNKNCLKCSYNLVCPGIIQDYLEKNGAEEFKPVSKREKIGYIEVLKNE